MNFFSSVYQSLYSVSFYRKVITEPLSSGLMYLVSWAFYTVFLFSLFLGFRVYPEVNQFIDWVADTVPPIQWTPEGAKMNQKSPYEMRHPKYGHIATINLDKKEITDAEMIGTMIYITSTKLYLKESKANATRIYDLVPQSSGDAAKRGNIIIDGAMIRGLEKSIKPVAFGGMAILIFIGFFVWKLMAALFYSSVGMMMNLFRRERLPYETVLNISCFAITASTCIQLVLMVLQAVSLRIPFGFIGSFVFTATYLYLGIKFTEETPETGIPSFEM